MPISPANASFIHFETLVHQPEIVLTQICAFLGLELDPAMLEPYAEQTVRMTNGVNASNMMVGDFKFHQHSTIESSVAEQWKKAYSTDFLSDRTWEIAECLGYRRADLPASMVSKPAKIAPHFTNIEHMLNELDALSEAEAQQFVLEKEF